MYALIMAGGVGSRLWPRSRKPTPKQLLNLTSERTMFQEAVARLEPLFEPPHAFVVTSAEYVPAMRHQVPALPAENYVIEPSGHGTAPCIGLAALYLRRLDPDAIMAVLTADHYIEKSDAFREALAAAGQIAREGYLVTLGIKPAFPSTGYGYILRDQKLTEVGNLESYRVKRFTEKPDLPTARKFVATGRYYWNSGMFVWRVAEIMAEFQRQMPALFAQLTEIDRAIGTPQEKDVLTRVWAEVENQTIDYGIMEGARNVAVIPVDIGWSDVGSWATLLDILPGDESGNVVTGQHLGIDTRRTLVYSPHRLVATVGLEDMIVVDTGDALLVCSKERAQDVKKVVDALKAQGIESLL
ncbi:MAG: mannose-1-phosphate guanylyltransferase [Chloroflexota bacterium]